MDEKNNKKKKKYTQKQIAERLGLSQSYVCKLLNGKQQPSLPVALRINSVLGVPLESLVRKDNHADRN